MEQRSEIDKKVQDAMDSLDGIQRAVPQPWLFSRVKGKLLQEQEEERTVWGVIGSILSRPAVAFAGLFLILFLNGVFLYKQERHQSTVAATEELQPNDSESLIASSSSFDFENLVQP